MLPALPIVAPPPPRPQMDGESQWPLGGRHSPSPSPSGMSDRNASLEEDTQFLDADG